MASFNVQVNVVSGESLADLTDKIKQESGRDKQSLNGLVSFLEGMLGGFKSFGSVTVDASASALVAASATATCAAVEAADTVTIAGVVLTAHSSTQNATTFAIGEDDEETAANIVTCIKANTSLKNWVTASSSGAVVTVSCLVKGVVGNCITFVSSNGTRLAVTGSGRLASGTGGNSDSGTGSRSYSFGG